MYRFQFFILGIILATAGSAWAFDAPNATGNADVGAGYAVDWDAFMAPHDPMWKRLPQEWWEAPYLGNGMLGTLIRKIGDRTLEWQVGRCDVEDHRSIPYGMGRLPIGSFHFATAGNLTDCDMRLNLMNAEVSGTIQTSEGSIQFRSMVHAEQMAIAIAWKGEGGESESGFEWVPQEAVHPRLTVHRETRPDFPLIQEWSPNPPGHAGTVEGDPVWVQPLTEGGYVTAWREAAVDDWRVLWVSVAYGWPGDLSAIAAEANGHVRTASSTPTQEFVASHRRWWREYYRQSFFSVSDPYWQSFYWNQVYKLGSATRQDGTILDLQGPWAQPTPWPGAWWNLNVQLTYWPMYTGNRLELAEPLPRSLSTYLPNLIASVEPEFREDSAGIYRSTTKRLTGGVFYPSLLGVPGKNEAEIGNLLWACHNVWLHYRMTQDEAMLRDVLFPILRRAVNYHRHFLYKDADGRLHLPETRSPEYKSGPDCNYDLALLRWGAGALLQITDRLGIEDPLARDWQDIVENLTAFPEDDAQGFLIARDVPMDSSHRHYSHLLMVYPLHLVNPEQPGGAERIRRSLDHWHSFPDALFGYSFTGGASIAALLRDGNLAMKYLNGFREFVEPNSMYREAGPVIETPLSAAQSIHDMFIQSWDAPDGPLIRVFPAVPDAWPDAVFHRWRAEGAFLVSAARIGGRAAWVQVTSLAGEPCRILVEFSGRPLVKGPEGFEIELLQGHRYSVPLERGQTALLIDPTYHEEVEVRPAADSVAKAPYFGLSADSNSKPIVQPDRIP
jgi:hypothetical protein